jgi:uncharacterized protein involved in exopolysaccharide biosynthesis
MTKISITSIFRDIPYRLYWELLHAWNVIYLRRWLVIAVVLGFAFVTVICCLTLLPIYSATCTIYLVPTPTDL